MSNINKLVKNISEAAWGVGFSTPGFTQSGSAPLSSGRVSGVQKGLQAWRKAEHDVRGPGGTSHPQLTHPEMASHPEIAAKRASAAYAKWREHEADLKASKPGMTQRAVDAAKKAYEAAKDIYHQYPTASKIAAGALAAGGAALAARKLLRKK